MMFVWLLLSLLCSAPVGEGAKALTSGLNQVVWVPVRGLVMEFDFPCFKLLANNDTAKAVGHQGGIVIPKDLATYFPVLAEPGTVERPTNEAFVEVELWCGGEHLGNTVTRYQHQTWGGKRSPERRLTSNLGILRDRASEGDLLLFYRSLTNPKKMKLELVMAGSAEYSFHAASFKNRRWGVLSYIPITNLELQKGEMQIERALSEPFSLFESEINRKESRTMRIARVCAFRNAVLNNFSGRCAITNRSLVSPSGNFGLDAAHIVPLGYKGTNDLRNGLALSKELHWGFDLGLLGIRDWNVVVAGEVLKDGRNDYLSSFNGFRIAALTAAKTEPSKDALDWHFRNIFLGT
jgi:putative restriction endonuclease